MGWGAGRCRDLGCLNERGMTPPALFVHCPAAAFGTVRRHEACELEAAVSGTLAAPLASLH